jgi:predicted kinase
MDQPLKLLIQMSGAPGSGKSTTAKLLAEAIDGVIVNHDLIKSFFLENNFPWQQSTQLTYRFQWTLAEDLIKQGRNVIMDSTCNYDNVLDQGMDLASRYGFEYKYIECHVKDIDLLDQRLRGRVPLRSQRTGVTRPPSDAFNGPHNEEEYRALFTRWIDNPKRPSEDVIVVDSKSVSPEKCLEYILKQIIHSTAVEKETVSRQSRPELLVPSTDDGDRRVEES